MRRKQVSTEIVQQKEDITSLANLMLTTYVQCLYKYFNQNLIRNAYTARQKIYQLEKFKRNF